MTDLGRLPRGRHGLSREEVAASQRARILLAMADVMTSQGYLATTVADILKGAGVSRETFYQQFSSKLDCFLATFDAATEILTLNLEPALGTEGSSLDRFDAALGAYLETLANQPAYARLFLVEVYAAGPEALERRMQFQRTVADRLMELLELHPGDRFALELVVAGTAALVTPLLVAGDTDAIRALRVPILELLVRVVGR
ncbi:MAG: TetR/AcrR family transcriptional regulator [Aquihabitans sp.]